MQEPDWMDDVLLYWDPIHEREPWTIRDSMEGLQVFGATGSAKSSGTGELVARAFLQHQCRFGGLVLCAKKSDRAMWERYVAEAGRLDDLLVVSMNPDDPPCRFNFLDDPILHQGAGGLVFNQVALLEVCVESMERSQSRGGESPFWKNQYRKFTSCGITLLKSAKGKVSLADLSELMVTAPRSLEETADWQALEARTDQLTPEERQTLQSAKAWHQSFCCEVIHDALQNAADELRPDVERAAQFFHTVIPLMPSETRESVFATVDGVLSYFLSHPLRELMTTETDISPTDAFDHKVIVVDFPPTSMQSLGVLVSTVFKYTFQLAVQSRTIDEHTVPVFLFADEAHLTLTKQDAIHQTIARGMRQVTVYISQGVEGYYQALGKELGHLAKHAAESLLGNLNTRVFHQNASPATNDYASKLIGKDWQWQSHGIGESTTSNFGREYSFNNSENLNVQRTYKNRLEPVAFSQLRRGGTDRQVDAIIFQGGRVFEQTGTNFMRTVLVQRDLSQDEEQSAAETMTVRCPNCRATSNWKTEDAGKTAECPHCEAAFTLPNETT